MRCLLLSLLLLTAVATGVAFLAPSVPLLASTTRLTSRFCEVVVRQGSNRAGRVGVGFRMSEDGRDNIDQELKKIIESRGSSLDKAMEDDEQYKKMAMEAARKRVEELKEKARNMPAPPQRKSDVVESPSFISQSPPLFSPALRLAHKMGGYIKQAEENVR